MLFIKHKSENKIWCLSFPPKHNWENDKLATPRCSRINSYVGLLSFIIFQIKKAFVLKFSKMADCHAVCLCDLEGGGVYSSELCVCLAACLRHWIGAIQGIYLLFPVDDFASWWVYRTNQLCCSGIVCGRLCVIAFDHLGVCMAEKRNTLEVFCLYCYCWGIVICWMRNPSLGFWGMTYVKKDETTKRRRRPTSRQNVIE